MSSTINFCKFAISLIEAPLDKSLDRLPTEQPRKGPGDPPAVFFKNKRSFRVIARWLTPIESRMPTREVARNGRQRLALAVVSFSITWRQA